MNRKSLWYVAPALACLLLPFAQPGAPDETEATRLHKLFDDDWKWAMEEYPEGATFVGYPGQNHRWSDLSPASIERRKQHTREILKMLDSFERAKLGAEDQLNYDLYRRFMWEQADGQRFPFEYLPISQLDGPQSELARVVAVMPTFSVKDYENIVARLNGIPVVVDQTISMLSRGLEKKVTPPRVTLRDVPQQIQNQIVEDPAKSAFLEPFLRMPQDIPEGERSRLTAEARAAVTGKVVPAFRKLYEYFVKTYLPGTRETIGLNALPDGQPWYAYVARVSTTTNLTPQQIHEIGLAQVKRLRGEMEKVMQQVGFKGTLTDFGKFLTSDARFFYSDADSVLAAYRDLAKRADPETVKLFGRVPRLPYGVIPVPDYSAKSETAAYYQGGSLAAGRPGNFFVNTYDVKVHQKWQMEALLLHEAVPGHHLQLSLAQEQEGSNVPEFRKQLGNTAYVEGWGLYAESLGYEMGFYKDPYSKFGQLNYDMWRACRLVLDTGIHAMGWSRDEALKFFRENTVLSDHELVVEVDRYIVWPGQALGYKIGQLKFLELRDYATKELGPAFNLRAFHDQVLAVGALPMDILEARVKDWVADQKTKQSRIER